MKHCIYCITNKINGKKYIGQTINFKHRIKQHCWASADKFYIDRAINKYGKDNFEFKVVHKGITTDKINQWEMFYINEVYNTFKGEGYNCHIGGGINFGDKSFNKGNTHSKEARRKMSENHADFSGEKHPRSKISKQEAEEIYNKYNNTQVTQEELAKKYPVSKSVIYSITKAKHWATKNKNPINHKKTNNGLTFGGGNNNEVGKEKVINIYNDYYNSEKTQKELSDEYDLSLLTVNRIVNNKHKYTKQIKKRSKIKNNIHNRKGKANPNSKISIKTAKIMLKEYNNSNKSYSKVGKDFGVSRKVVGELARGEHWTCKHF